MGEKVTTIMRLKVDLECDKCYKKVKKVLSKFPQIRDQVYDEKNNTVTIMVVCCSPEKTRDKICCKGCGVIKSIEILEPPKPKPAEKPKEVPKQNPNSDPKPAEMPKEKPSDPKPAEMPKEKPAPPPPEPKPAAEPPKLEPEKPKQKPQEKEEPMPKPKEKPKEKAPSPPHEVPPPMAVPIGVCCMDCYHGRPGGPCFDGYGGPPQPPAFCYDDAGYYGRPVYDSYYGGSSRRPCYVSRCDEYLCEDNTSAACIVM